MTFIIEIYQYECEDVALICKYQVMHKCNVDIGMAVHQYDNAYDVSILTIQPKHNRIRNNDVAFHVYAGNEYVVPILQKW